MFNVPCGRPPQVVRAICHTQVKKIPNLRLKKAHLIEIQINGGKSVSEKVDFAYKYFEKARAPAPPRCGGCNASGRVHRAAA